MISGEYGQAKHTAIPAELLHNSRKRETAKEGSTAQPGESGFVVWAKAKTIKRVFKIKP